VPGVPRGVEQLHGLFEVRATETLRVRRRVHDEGLFPPRRVRHTRASLQITHVACPRRTAREDSHYISLIAQTPDNESPSAPVPPVTRTVRIAPEHTSIV